MTVSVNILRGITVSLNWFEIPLSYSKLINLSIEYYVDYEFNTAIPILRKDERGSDSYIR